MSNLTGLVKRVRKIMRKDNGVDGDAQRINQLVWMLFLKVYDELKESNEYELEIDNYKSIIPEEYRWRNWAVEKLDEEGRVLPDTLTGDDLVDFINNGLFPTLRDLPVDESTPKRSSIVKYVFSRLHNYMINGTLIRQVINELNKIDFDEYEDRHVFNEIYESILKELQNAGSSGEFYTPRPVTDFMAEMLVPKSGEKVADFACGTGGFLVSAINHMLKENNSQATLDSMQENIIGCECKPLPYLLCVTNMLLNGTDGSNIRYGSSLAKNVFEYTDDDKVDVVLMNPPFGGEIAPGEDKNFPEIYRTSETANLFVCLVLYRLKQNGRVAIVLPDGFLFNNTEPAFVELKKKLMNECNLHTIVRLPSGLFYASVSTNVLFFEKTNSTNGVWYYEVPLPAGYRTFSKTKPFLDEHLDSCRNWWFNRTNGDKNAYFVTQEEIIKNNYSLYFKNPNIDENKDKISLVDSLSNLSDLTNKTSKNINSIAALLDGKNIFDSNGIRKKIIELAITGNLINEKSSEDSIEFIKSVIKDKKIKLSDVLKDEEKYLDTNEDIHWVKLQILCDITTGASFAKDEARMSFKEGYTRVLRGGNISPMKWSFKFDDLFIPTDKVKKSIFIKKYDIISPAVTSLENVGKFAQINSDVENTTIGGFVFLLTPVVNDYYFSKYLLYYFTSSIFIEKLKKITKKSGAAFYNINKELLKDLLVPIPNRSDIKTIVEKLDKIFDDLDSIEENLKNMLSML